MKTTQYTVERFVGDSWCIVHKCSNEESARAFKGHAQAISGEKCRIIQETKERIEL